MQTNLKMNKRSELSHIYHQRLPWYHRADIVLFSIFLRVRNGLLPAGYRVSEQFPVIGESRASSCILSRTKANVLLFAAIFNLIILWLFVLPIAPQIAVPIIVAHLIGLALLFLFHPNPALGNHQSEQSANSIIQQ